MDKDFFEKSALSRKVKVPLRIIMQRGKLTSHQLAELEKQGEIPLTSQTYQLEVGGAILGIGTIVEKEGKRLFRLQNPKGETTK